MEGKQASLFCEDTIFALATPIGRGAISVFRVSGPKTQELIGTLAAQPLTIIRNPRKQIYTAIYYQEEILDYALLTFFEKGRSYTGEDSLELSIHASNYIIKSLHTALSNLGMREAQAGEFTQRAYLNGKLDLTQAEAVCDLINSETRSQARASREQLEGRLGKAVDDVGEPLRNILAEIEAHIDFPEEDIDPLKPREWKKITFAVQSRISEFLDSYKIGRLYREGALIVLAGIPNAGKSSLMNALLKEDRVIVTNVPGTTRDTIEEKLEIGGMLCRIVDTAGLANGLDPNSKNNRIIGQVEKIGIKRSYDFISKADLVLFLFDRSQEATIQITELKKVIAHNKPVIIALSKSDICSAKAIPQELNDLEKLEISIQNSENKYSGIKSLELSLTQKLVGQDAPYSVIFTNARHQECLLNAAKRLETFLNAINTNQPLEIVSFELRTVLSHLAEIVGNTETEDILGRIFSKFCIGK